MKRVLHYLSGTKDTAPRYQNSEDNRLVIQMLIGLVIMMIDTLSRKQADVALSTSEAEYIALSAQKAAWL